MTRRNAIVMAELQSLLERYDRIGLSFEELERKSYFPQLVHGALQHMLQEERAKKCGDLYHEGPNRTPTLTMKAEGE